MSRVVELARDAFGAASSLVDRALGFHLDLTVVVALCALAVVVAFASVQGQGRDGSSPLRAVPRMALALVLVTILALTLQPRPGTAEGLNLVPLASFERYLTGGVDLVLAVRNLAFNVLLFVPYGLVRALQRAAAGGRAVVALVTLEAFALSVAIEAVQLLAPIGRVSDVDDVLTNVVGGLLGAIAGGLVAHAARSLSGGRAPAAA